VWGLFAAWAAVIGSNAASLRQAAARAPKRDEFIQIWFNESCVSDSYAPS